MDVTTTLSSIIQNAYIVNKPTENDYVAVDGLVYCGKCKEPKQCREMVFGELTVLPIPCKCVKEAYAKEEQRIYQMQLEAKVSGMRVTAFGANSKYITSRFDTSDGSNESVMNAAKMYCEKFDEFKRDGKGLMLYGECGTGKSFIAACIANQLIDKGISVIFTTMSKIVNKLQSTFDKREIYDVLREVPLLIIDDFRAERSTEFMNEVTFEVINGRAETRMPLIVTTNLTAEDIKGEHGISQERVISRLLGMCIPIEVKGSDKRREMVKQSYSSDLERLGLR